MDGSTYGVPVWAGPAYVPVLFCAPFGLLPVMPRADEPATERQVAELEDRIGRECKAFTDAEGKRGAYRLLKGEVVAVDYGLAHRDLVRERREYSRMVG